MCKLFQDRKRQYIILERLLMSFTFEIHFNTVFYVLFLIINILYLTTFTFKHVK